MKRLTKADRAYWTKKRVLKSLDEVLGKSFERFFSKSLKEDYEHNVESKVGTGN